MRSYYLILFFPLFLLCGCGKNQRAAMVRNEVVYDSVVIYNDFPYLSYYGIYSSVVRNGCTLLVGYNWHIHSLDFFDLSAGKSLSSLSLEREGENGVSKDITGLFLTPSSILVSQLNSQLLKLDYNGVVVNKVDGYEITDPETGNMYMLTSKGVSLGSFVPRPHSFQGRSMVVQTLYPLAALTADNLSAYYVGMEVDMESGEVRFIPVRYSDILQPEDLEEYGHMVYPYLMDCGAFLLINSPFSSDVYRYDRRSGKLACYQPRSVFTANRSTALLAKNKYERVFQEYCSLRFLQVHYSEKLDVFYRVHLGENDRDSKVRDCRVLMVMDRNMEVICEVKLPEYFGDSYVVVDDVVYFYLENKTDDMYLGAVKLADLIGR